MPTQFVLQQPLRVVAAATEHGFDAQWLQVRGPSQRHQRSHAAAQPFAWVLLPRPEISLSRRWQGWADSNLKALAAAMDADTILPPDVCKSIATRAAGPPQADDASSAVFITGGTGFVGAHVIAQLLQRSPPRKLFCLARARDAQHATDRVLAGLESATPVLILW